MKVWHWVMAGTVVVVCLWLIGVSVASLTCNGFFYHIQQPVPVVKIFRDRADLGFLRWSKLDMSGTCSNELQCDHVYEFGRTACPLERGEAMFLFTLPIPEGASGSCVYRGTVEYAPFGTLGPRLTHMWTSETFQVPDPLEQ